MDRNKQTIIQAPFGTQSGTKPGTAASTKAGNWITLLVLPVLLSACGWVDSTGDGSDDIDSEFSPLTSVAAQSNDATPRY